MLLDLTSSLYFGKNSKHATNTFIGCEKTRVHDMLLLWVQDSKKKKKNWMTSMHNSIVKKASNLNKWRAGQLRRCFDQGCISDSSKDTLNFVNWNKYISLTDKFLIWKFPNYWHHSNTTYCTNVLLKPIILYNLHALAISGEHYPVTYSKLTIICRDIKETE